MAEQNKRSSARVVRSVVVTDRHVPQAATPRPSRPGRRRSRTPLAALAAVATIAILVPLAIVLGGLLPSNDGRGVGGDPSPTGRTAKPGRSATAGSGGNPTAEPTTGPGTATPTPDATTTPIIPSLLGEDGRLTFLLLGSDRRPGYPGVRTDTMMVVSVDAKSREAAAVSIPRDVARFPIPDGGLYSHKINTLYEWYVKREGDHDAGAARTKEAIADLLDIEIDYWVFTGFGGVRQLVDAVGGVDVYLEKSIRDPRYRVDGRPLYFPPGLNHLDGQRALAFARTRKADSDFQRADRQQLLVMGGVKALRDVDLADVPVLVGVVREYLRTDLPLAAAAELYRLARRIDVDEAKRAVLAPPRFGHVVTGPGLWQIRLDVDEARDYLDDWFAADR